MRNPGLPFDPKLIQILQEANRITVLTGAGISAESGIPTFRQAQNGLWAKYNPHELATPQAFKKNPSLVWKWYTWRRGIIAQAEPNAGHTALVRLEQYLISRGSDFSLITQNVDNLHQRAGSRRIYELHGNITRSRCFEENILIQGRESLDGTPPQCPRCRGPLRPDVIWFGETLPADILQTAIEVSQNCDAFLSLGTSALVEPAASLPFLARRSDATIIEVNSQRTPLSPYASFVLDGQCGDILPAMVDTLTNSD
jgi:NAD-dependent deacetylase